MLITRKDIIQEARSWLGTRFHHQGRVKGGGCDCIGLIMGVAERLQLVSPVTGEKLTSCDRTGYSRYPDGIALKQALDCCLRPVVDFKPGDVLLLRFEENPQHVAFVSDYEERYVPNHGLLRCARNDKDRELGMIHCYAQARKVVEHRLDDTWRARIVAAYGLL